MILLLPCILGLFFILTSFYIWKKSQIFFLVYLLLFAYTFFTQFGYLCYPKQLNSSHLYYGEGIFITYWVYVFLSFISIFLIFVLFYHKKYKTLLKIQLSSLSRKSSDFLYTGLILLYNSALLFFLVKNYKDLNYSNQAILKNNKIWLYLFSLAGIVLLSLFYKIYIERTKKKRTFYSFLFLILLLIFFVTTIKSGQRIQVATTVLGFTAFLWYLFKDKIRCLKLKHVFVVLILCFILILFFQGVRMSRGLKGHREGLGAFFNAFKKPRIYVDIFFPKELIFQDWLSPSLTLAASIEYNIVFPGKVIESNFKSLFPFIKHTSLGRELAKIIDPSLRETYEGYGYYILTEGYNIMGFFGFIYSAFIFVFGLRLLESFFTNTGNKTFNSYMYGIIAFSAIMIVRGGQTMVFLKMLYLYFFPAIILFLLMNNKKIYLVGPKLRT